MNLESRVHREAAIGRAISVVMRPGGAERLAGVLHPDITCILPGLQKCDVFAIRRKVNAGNFGIAEKQFAANEAWKTLHPLIPS